MYSPSGLFFSVAYKTSFGQSVVPRGTAYDTTLRRKVLEQHRVACGAAAVMPCRQGHKKPSNYTSQGGSAKTSDRIESSIFQTWRTWGHTLGTFSGALCPIAPRSAQLSLENLGTSPTRLLPRLTNKGDDTVHSFSIWSKRFTPNHWHWFTIKQVLLVLRHCVQPRDTSREVSF